MPEQPACELLWVESASFKKEPVLAGCQRQIIGKEVDRIKRVVVEDEQLVGLVLPVEIPHEARDRIGQADSAGLADSRDHDTQWRRSPASPGVITAPATYAACLALSPMNN